MSATVWHCQCSHCGERIWILPIPASIMQCQPIPLAVLCEVCNRYTVETEICQQLAAIERRAKEGT